MAGGKSHVVRKIKLGRICLKFSCLLFIYVGCAGIINQIVIRGNDCIADAVDCVMSGQALQMQSLMQSLLWMTAAGAALSYIKSLSGNAYSAKIQKEVRETLAEHLVKMPFGYFDEKSSGSVITKLSSDLGEIGRFFSEILPEFLLSLISIVMVTGYLVQMDIRLIIILFTSYPLMLFATNKVSQKVAKITKKYRARMDDRTQIAYDAIQGIVVGRSYNLYRIIKRRMDTVIDDIAEEMCKSTRISSMGWVMKHILTTIPVVICYLFALYENLQGRITIGEMVAFIALLGRIIEPIGAVVFCAIDIRTAGIAFGRLQEIYEVEEERTGGTEFPEKRNLEESVIAWDNIHFAYQEEREILQGISFEARSGENIAFVGGSGEGKSTIFRLLLGFYLKKAGNYSLFGKRIEEWGIEELRNCFSYVSQNVFLLPGSIYENVACGKENATWEEVKAACKAAEIHSFIESLPEGYDSIVGERGTKLSGGESQRLSIARAFLKDAPIILLDEPTAAVDVETENRIQSAMARITKGKTVLVIAHRLSTVIQADRIYVVNNGKIAETGTHAELIAKNGIYAGLYGKEVTGDET